METKLYLEFEKELDKEAKRIAKKIINKYNNKEQVNKSFSELINSLIKKDFEYYSIDIEMRCLSFIPKTLEPDITGKYALITHEERIKQHFLSYYNFCKNSLKNKDHEKAASDLANMIISYCENKPLTTIGLPELVAEKMSVLFPEHNDSVDSRTTIYFLQPELNKRGYAVTSLVPLRIIKK